MRALLAGLELKLDFTTDLRSLNGRARVISTKNKPARHPANVCATVVLKRSYVCVFIRMCVFVLVCVFIHMRVCACVRLVSMHSDDPPPSPTTYDTHTLARELYSTKTIAIIIIVRYV